MNKLPFIEFSDTDSLEMRREKLNALLNYTLELETTLSQFSDLFSFMKSTYNSKPYFFNSINAMADCKFLQNEFTCVCLISKDDSTYLRYYKITNSELSAPDEDNIVSIVHDSTLKAVKIPDLFGIENLVIRVEDLTNRVEDLEELSGGDGSE